MPTAVRSATMKKTRRRAGTASDCPMCGKPVVHRFRPFCGRRCANLDLARWLDGSYAVPTDDAPESPDDSAPGGATG